MTSTTDNFMPRFSSINMGIPHRHTAKIKAITGVRFMIISFLFNHMKELFYLVFVTVKTASRITSVLFVLHKSEKVSYVVSTEKFVKST